MYHKSDYIIEDLIGGFKIFFVSIILVYMSLITTISLYPNFPIKQDSSWVISIIAGLLIVFFNFLRDKNKDYFS